ncbi:fam-a protein, fragment [Plasmodium vinckei vinckei]|uniref:Fam-a protein n=1 Tax=Plasmodium vinckei vinckei TaxID=54757 RepID=A0A081IA84_PLAVN|nr:fam-a protein, fragment [Plasmodium vinckei vinckei]KEG00592.1 hypothetical protein YYE_04421 [Plasmodium vinckei vinckei]VEV54711.1 fam-a protein, fragment [Plasmodium vinckei vinckei]
MPPNINDHSSKNTKSFQNAIIENANLFKTDIDSEDDIRNGKSKKTLTNIAGYIIEKKDRYVDSSYRHGSIYQKCNFKNIEDYLHLD